jgi:intracellular multiplication protein IcmG
MVDKTQDNDEYEFVDYDTISTDPMGQDEEVVESRTTRVRSADGGSHVIRNALIALALVLIALVVYRFISSFTKKTTSSDASIPAITTPTNQTETPINQPLTTPINPATTTDTSIPVASDPTTGIQPQSTEIAPVQTTTSSTTTPTTVTVSTPSPDISQIDQKMSAIDVNQQGIRADINTLNNQLSGISSNISNLNVKIENLTQVMTTLSATIEKQANQITALTTVKKAPKVKKIVRRVIIPRRVYYIQAVIPGRAWLIASNGSTLTVREGTNIPGYGVVKLIDPNQGRVLTSSGQIIRFSQQDS